MPAERYRDSQRPGIFDASIASTSDSAQRLSASFADFARTATGLSDKLDIQRGTEEGAAAGASGKPEFRRGFRALSTYSQAYNNAATRTYSIHAEADADDTAARLEAEAGTDPEKFQKVFGAVRDEAMKNADPATRAILDEVYARRMSQGTQRLEFARVQEVKKDARSATAEGISRYTDKIAQLRSSDDPAAHQEADEEELKLDLLLKTSMGDGTLSPTEAAALHIDASREIVRSTVVKRFAREFDSPYGDPVGFIEKLREANKTSEALPPAEEAKLQDELLAELRERNALAAAKVTHGQTERELRWIEGDRVGTEALLSGSLTRGTLLKMIRSDDIKPEVARTLQNELDKGPVDKSDPRSLAEAEINLMSLTKDDILVDGALSWSDRSRLILKQREWTGGWRGTHEAQEGAERFDRALHIVPGTAVKAMSEEELRKRGRALTLWYNEVDALPEDERRNAAIPIADRIVREVIQKDASEEAEMWQGRIARWHTTYPDPSTLSEKSRTTAQSELERFEKALREAQSKAK